MNSGSTSDSAAVEARGLTCRYGDFEAVSAIDLTVRRGEVFALLGTNGAGKTTTLETLEGHRRPDGGQVRVLGMDPVRERRQVRRRAGVMLQESGFAGDLTVRETLDLASRLRTGRPDPKQAAELVGLTHRSEVRVVGLSGGEKRRLDLAIATLGRPEVLFLDEPTTGMDPESRENTLSLVRDFVAGGATVVLTTHYLEEAEALADTIAIMHQARIAVQGSRSEVLSRQPGQIRFALRERPTPAIRDELRRWAPGWVVDAQGTWLLRTESLQQDLAALLAWADSRALDLIDLDAHHASLDDVFRAVVLGEAHAARQGG